MAKYATRLSIQPNTNLNPVGRVLHARAYR